MFNLKSEIQNEKKIIAVYGLGHVGGPLATAWLRSGAKVIGVDTSTNHLSDIQNGTSHRLEPLVSETITTALEEKKITLTSDGIEASKMSHVKFVAVPVGLVKDKVDLSALLSTAETISKGLKKGDAVVICPSLPPGTTEKIVGPVLEKNASNLKIEKDFYLIYSPERIFEGRSVADIEENYPAIISGYDKKSLDFADELFSIISKKGTHRMSSLADAEAEKLFEGVYRDTNIAIANELAEYSEAVGVNFWQAREAANTHKPYTHLHRPGTGVGGLCIPVYPKFIMESSQKIGKYTKLIEYSRIINDNMPKKCVNDALQHLNRDTNGIKVAVLGLGFRGEVTDSRLSPTYTVVDELLSRGCNVIVHDPYIFEDSNLSTSVTLTKDLDKAIYEADLVFISTDHKIYSDLTENVFTKNNKQLPLIFDGRNILNRDNFKNISVITIGTRNNSKTIKH